MVAMRIQRGRFGYTAGSARSNSSFGFMPVICTNPPSGMGAIWKMVPLRWKPSRVGPNPMEKRSTRIPHSRATRKCPPSCRTMRRPRPTMATRIDSIAERLAWTQQGPRSWERPSGRQEAEHGTQQQRRGAPRARADHVDPKLLRTALEHRLEEQAGAAGADDHRKRGQAAGHDVAPAQDDRIPAAGQPRQSPAERGQLDRVAR